MPEDPSIMILKEPVQDFKGKKVLEIGGNTRVDFSSLVDKRLLISKALVKIFLSASKMLLLKFISCYLVHTG